MSNHTINIENSLKKIKNPHVVVEILTKKDITQLTDIWLDSVSFGIAQKNLWKKWDSHKKSISFPVSIGKIEKITCFFPDSDHLMDDRSDLFRGLETESMFVPATHPVDAYEALWLASYRYQDYLTEKKSYNFAIFATPKEQKEMEAKIPLYTSIYWARDIINMPPRDANPIALTDMIVSYPWRHFTVEVFHKADLEKLGCNLLLAVGAGSDIPPTMVVLTPKAPPKWEKYALIGKGVTFDAWGIQIKPDTGMLDMKCDMSGAAGMIGVAKYLDTFDILPVNLTVAVGFTENMTGGSAFKPLDIYKAYNGVTVEIHHTDAEGRLVLADVMSYVEQNHHVDHIITMATLTWACIYALGHDITGIMGDDEGVISSLLSSTSPYEPVWRLPLNDKIKKSLKTDIADLKNIARSEKAGSSVGGAFLTYFQWKAKLTHLDIAGPAYRDTPYGYMPKWGTGWGVKILSEFFLSLKSSKK
jgi:leucyl aminopeptidase